MMARRAAAVILLTLCLGAPVAELFDRWDPVDHEGSDSELALVVASACVGMALTAATTALLSGLQPVTVVGSANFNAPRLLIAISRQRGIPGSCGSPPTNLRI
jgi:hypothetical protein